MTIQVASSFLSLTSGRVDFIVQDAAGNVIRDSKAERITAQTSVVNLLALKLQKSAPLKAHGRDIENEEKHEFEDSDIISLRPRQPHEHSSTYRRWGDDN